MLNLKRGPGVKKTHFSYFKLAPLAQLERMLLRGILVMNSKDTALSPQTSNQSPAMTRSFTFKQDSSGPIRLFA